MIRRHDARDIAVELNLARDQRPEDFAGRAIRHVRGLGSSPLQKRRTGQMPRRARAGTAVGEFSRRRFECSDELGNRFDVQTPGGHGKPDRDVDGRRDRDQVLDRIVRKVGIKCRGDARRRQRGQHERIAVRRLLRNVVGADRAAGAGTVLDDDSLTEQFAHFGGEQAHGDVRAATGSKRDDDADQPIRPVACLGPCDHRGKYRHRGQGQHPPARDRLRYPHVPFFKHLLSPDCDCGARTIRHSPAIPVR